MATTYPLSVARTLALYAQGLSNRNQDDSLISTTDFQRMIEQLGCVQIDTLHMVRRSHYLVLWSRLGSYEPADLDALIYSPEQRQLFEQLAKTMGSEVRPQERSFFDWLKETLGG